MRTYFDALRSLNRYVALALGDTWEVTFEPDQAKVDFPYARIFTVGPMAQSGSAHTIEVTQRFNIQAYTGAQSTVVDAVAQAAGAGDAIWTALRRGVGVVPPPTGLSATPDAGALPAGTYRYVVTSLGDTGESTASAAVSGVLSATGAVALLWTHAPGAQGYRIFRGASGSERLLGEVAYVNGFTDDGTVTPHPTTAPPPSNFSAQGAPMRVPLYDYVGVALDTGATTRHPHDYMRVVDLSLDTLADPEDESVRAALVDVQLRWRRIVLDEPSGTPLTRVKGVPVGS